MKARTNKARTNTAYSRRGFLQIEWAFLLSWGFPRIEFLRIQTLSLTPREN